MSNFAAIATDAQKWDDSKLSEQIGIMERVREVADGNVDEDFVTTLRILKAERRDRQNPYSEPSRIPTAPAPESEALRQLREFSPRPGDTDYASWLESQEDGPGIRVDTGGRLDPYAD